MTSMTTMPSTTATITSATMGMAPCSSLSDETASPPSHGKSAYSKPLVFDIQVDDARAPDVEALLTTHLAFAGAASPPEYSFALGARQLSEPAVTLFSARSGGRLMGIAALKRLDGSHAELKSMHTRAAERGQGVGRALVAHILAYARMQGYGRVSLETGTTAEFEAARRLYFSVGFLPCGPFGDYRPSPYNTFMAIDVS